MPLFSYTSGLFILSLLEFRGVKIFLMEDKEILDVAIVTDRKEPAFQFKKPSIWLIIKTILKLIPVILYLRTDRREWVKKEGKNVKCPTVRF